MATIGPSTLTYLYGSVSVCAHRLNLPARRMSCAFREVPGDNSDFSVRRVRVPDRHSERSSPFFADTYDSHVKIGEKALAFLLRHRRRHGTLPSVARQSRHSRDHFDELGLLPQLGALPSTELGCGE